jgi:hypothetical protein
MHNNVCQSHLLSTAAEKKKCARRFRHRRLRVQIEAGERQTEIPFQSRRSEQEVAEATEAIQNF